MKYLNLFIFLSFVLLFPITGAMGVIFNFEEPWSGSVESPKETFLNYSCPIPMCMGATNLFEFPFTYGPLFFLHIKRTRKYLFPIFALYLIGVIIYNIYHGLNSHYWEFCSFTIINAVAALGVLAITYTIEKHNIKNGNKHAVSASQQL